MRGHQRVINVDVNKEIFNTLYYEDQGKNATAGVEAIILLKLLVVIEKKGRNIEEGQIIVGLDDRKTHREIVEETQKTSKTIKDAEAEIAEMRDV